MTATFPDTSTAGSIGARRHASPETTRLIMASLVAGAAVAGFVLTSPESAAHAVSSAGEDLTRLLRAMAVIKAVLALGATAAVVWRLGAAITLPWFGAYALACAGMAAGPGLIWTMAHVGLGALLLHGGLLGAVLLLWRDPVLSTRLGAIVAERRRFLRAHS